MVKTPAIRRLLLAWYDRSKRDLPWRNTRDPWRILLSEVMLQQTRVQAALPYYERFVARFPTPADLAAAPTQDVLAMWSGLGYYARARNLQRAAAAIAQLGSFPSTYEGLRALPGIGEYTAAAIGSIAFGLPEPVLDGNVIRVAARVTRETGDTVSTAVRARLKEAAQQWLDPRRPGDFNQALMELGATVCLPRQPQCLLCPLRDHCQARVAGQEQELPIRLRRRNPVKLQRGLLVVEKAGKLLLRQRDESESRLAGFWELPDCRALPEPPDAERLGSFRHSITRHDYEIEVWRVAAPRRVPKGYRWVSVERLRHMPLATTARKALVLAGYPGLTPPRSSAS